MESTKGSDGGYAIADRNTSAWDILRILDGPVKTFSPPLGKGTLPCDFPSHCRTNEALRKLEEAVKRTLSDITLETIASPDKKS